MPPKKDRSNEQPPPLLRIADVATQLGMSEAFVLREIARGRLVARRHTSHNGRVQFRIEPAALAGYEDVCGPRT